MKLVILLIITNSQMSHQSNDIDSNFTTEDQLTLYFKEMRKLEQRIKSLEQPAWDVSKSEKRWVECSEGPCRCSQETLTLACRRQNLKEIPRRQSVPFETNTIDISGNEIEALHKGMFHDLSSLTDLDISYNKLNYLPESIFESLSSLQNLKLRNNLLEDLSGHLLRDQGQLETLDVASNNLITVDGRLLKGTRRLLAINLGSNWLEEIPEELLEGLELLEDLNLSGNNLRALKPNSLKGLTNLRTIDFSRNNISHLSQGLFRDTKKVVVISATNNQITFIDPTQFQGLDRLTFLDLTANRISKMSGEHLPTHLVELHLGLNRLKHVPPLKELPNLRRLFLFSNHINNIPADYFRAFSSLRTLFLNNNNISRIETGLFDPLMELRNLQLDSNKLIQMPQGVFKRNTLLSAVKLTKNPWHCDCSIWDLAKWLKENKDKVWGLEPTCLGPGELGGTPIDQVSYSELCEYPSYNDDNGVLIEPLITSHVGRGP